MTSMKESHGEEVSRYSYLLGARPMPPPQQVRSKSPASFPSIHNSLINAKRNLSPVQCERPGSTWLGVPSPAQPRALGCLSSSLGTLPQGHIHLLTTSALSLRFKLKAV